jgi:L-threonylcarbamoyladenylate synthase
MPNMLISQLTAQESIKNIAKKLSLGALVGIPTETVYGLAANAENEVAVARIYLVKARPSNHPVIVHIQSLDYIFKWAINVPIYALKLAQKYWPGPMTLILERSHLARDFITGGQNTIGIRVPAHATTLALLREFHNLGGNGIVAPSANRFGSVSPTNAEAVNIELGRYLDPDRDMIIDGGQCAVGIESTIIDCTDVFPKILRPGAISTEMILSTSGLEATNNTTSIIRVPGTLDQHYSPKARITLSGKVTLGDGFIALKRIETPNGGIRIASPENLDEFARILYSAFREADYLGIKNVVVIPPEGGGLAIAIRDRIARAAR